jgi:predicted enzyme related to lactoylglutathione lyase
MVTGLRFVWLEVSDLERSLRFYREGLGLHVEETASCSGKRTACVKAGELELVLAESSLTDQPRGTGVRLYLVTHDVEHYAAALPSRGIEAGAPIDEPWGGRVVEVADPDGYRLCLVQSRHHMMPDEP